MVGKINIRFGWVWLILFLILGFYLMLKVSDPSWGGLQRGLWRAAHVHGALLAFVNLFYGLLIDKTNLRDGVKLLGSWLVVIGAILFSGALFLLPFIPAIGILEPIGAGAIIASIAIIGYGSLGQRNY